MRLLLRNTTTTILGLALASWASWAGATTVLQTDLSGLCHTAHRIVVGRVVSVEPGKVTAGGGEMPVITYTVEVDKTFKGDVEVIKGRRVVRMTTLGKLSAGPGGEVRRALQVPGLPQLVVGERYLLFTTRPGAAGLSTTVGLGQGCFRISGEPGRETAVNGFDNRGLLDDRPARDGRQGRTAGTEATPADDAGDAEAAAVSGPMPLADLAARIRAELEGATESP